MSHLEAHVIALHTNVARWGQAYVEDPHPGPLFPRAPVSFEGGRFDLMEARLLENNTQVAEVGRGALLRTCVLIHFSLPSLPRRSAFA